MVGDGNDRADGRRESTIHGRESTYGEVVDARRVIAKLHTLAADPRNRPFIARDSGCLRNIIRTFDFPAEDVVYKALETLSYLSSHSKENRDCLRQQPGLIAKLHELKEMHVCEEVNELAEHLHTQLTTDKAVEAMMTPEKRQPLATVSTNKIDQLRMDPSPASKTMQARPARTMMFKVEGLTGEEDKDRLERAIIRTKGVISVSLDQFQLGDSAVMRILSQRQITVRAVVRAKCPPEEIIAACERNELNACVYDPTHDARPEKSPDRGDRGTAGYETPLSERSTQHGTSAGDSDSPRYLTPPDLNACGDRVLVSMEDKTIGLAVSKENKKDDGLNWIQKVGRILWW